MSHDPIVDEVRGIRDEHAARYDYDLDRIFDALVSEERRAGLVTVSLTPRPATKGSMRHRASARVHTTTGTTGA